MSSSLQSVRYERGALSVLDQLLLPHEKQYIAVAGSEDAWSVIRTMQVRGAPLIAIVAALGLAVEIQNKSAFECAQDCGDFLLERMTYLRTSRPTAVNLFVATDELAALVKGMVASPGSSHDSVKTAFIDAAEEIFRKDVETNKSIGDHGARRIAEIVKQTSGRSTVRILTICNTGSLATAGYGTALGVVRSLHEQGILEHVYACETRPYNQGARLTAFEIVEDKLPGTLITDSMASALMTVKGVDAVVVGADRVASNGDTANKIGTYQLAIAAQYHNVPFFAAVPTTTLDLKMTSGAEIHVEQRPQEELTTIFGQRIAPEGINAWNPSFDVTPCKLIRGIITEVGVAEAAPLSENRENTDRVIDIPSFLRSKGMKSRCEGAVEVRTNAPVAFKVMTEAMLADYLSEMPKMRDLLGMTAENTGKDLAINEIGDGNLNFVYIVAGPTGAGTGTGKKVVVKQALPYIRVVESWPLTLDRAGFETRALQEQRRLCPELVPEVYHFDPTLALIIMRFIEAPHIILRKALIAGEKFPHFARHLSDFMAKTLFGTSALKLGGKTFRARVSEWSNNSDLCALTEKVVFTDPYSHGCDANRWTTPQLDPFAAFLSTNEKVKACAAQLKAKFVGCPQALIHGDLHSGSVMACKESTFVIDPEFAFYGPMGFDIGAIVANLLLAYYSQDGHATEKDDRQEYKQWIMVQLCNMLSEFHTGFVKLWSETINSEDTHSNESELYRKEAFPSSEGMQKTQQLFMANLWRDVLGFAGMKMVRRCVGISHVEDMESIQIEDKRALCEARAIVCGTQLICMSQSHSSTTDSDGACRYAPWDAAFWVADEMFQNPSKIQDMEEALQLLKKGVCKHHVECL